MRSVRRSCLRIGCGSNDVARVKPKAAFGRRPAHSTYFPVTYRTYEQSPLGMLLMPASRTTRLARDNIGCLRDLRQCLHAFVAEGENSAEGQTQSVGSTPRARPSPSNGARRNTALAACGKKAMAETSHRRIGKHEARCLSRLLAAQIPQRVCRSAELKPYS